MSGTPPVSPVDQHFGRHGEIEEIEVPFAAQGRELQHGESTDDRFSARGCRTNGSRDPSHVGRMGRRKRDRPMGRRSWVWPWGVNGTVISSVPWMLWETHAEIVPNIPGTLVDQFASLRISSRGETSVGGYSDARSTPSDHPRSVPRGAASPPLPHCSSVAGVEILRERRWRVRWSDRLGTWCERSP